MSKKSPSSKANYQAISIPYAKDLISISDLKTNPAFTSGYYCCDESGVGDLFGPIIFVAYYGNDQIAQKLQTEFNLDLETIKDSKKLSGNQIKVLAPKLTEANPQHHVLVLSNLTFNEQFKKRMNLKELMTFYHVKNLNQKSFPPKIPAVIDGFLSAKKFRFYQMKGKLLSRSIYLRPKAEKDIYGVAAASIIARYLFIRKIDQIKARIKYSGTILGAGNETKELIQHLRQLHGLKILKEIIKLNYRYEF